MTTAEDVLKLVNSQIGTCENPLGSNSGTPYHSWFGSYSQGWKWCAIFVSWIVWHTDPNIFYRVKSAYSGTWLDEGRKYGRQISIAQIKPGDIVIWDRPVGGITDHIGFVEYVTLDTFTTIEGNSGNCVRRNRHLRIQTDDCRYYFVRPVYTEKPTPEEDDEEMTEVTVDSPKRFPAMPGAGKKTFFDITDESKSGQGATIRLSARRDFTAKYPKGDWSKVEEEEVKPESSFRFESGQYFGITDEGCTVKVEVLKGGPVGVTRKQTL